MWINKYLTFCFTFLFMDRRSTVVTKRGRGEMYGNKLNAAQSRLSPELNLRQLQKSQNLRFCCCAALTRSRLFYLKLFRPEECTMKQTHFNTTPVCYSCD